MSSTVSANITQLLSAKLTNLDNGQAVQELNKDGNYRLNVSFISENIRASKVIMRLTLIIGNSEIRLPFFRKRNFCQHQSSSLDCPLASNRVNNFILKVHIPSQTPTFNGTLQLKLLNENKEKILCFLFPLIVQ